MNKPNSWDTTEAMVIGDFKTITPGGHICKIKQAKVDETRSGKEILIIMFDVAEGEFKDFYTTQYDERKKTKSDTKYQGIYRQLTEGNSLKFFKGILKSIEESNNGYKWAWDETTLKGKLFGGLFGQEEWQNNNGDIKLSTKCTQIRTVQAIKDGVEAPAIKRLNGGSTGGDTTYYADMKPVDDGDIPF